MQRFLAASLVLAASTAFAAPGDFDTTFGQGGITPFGNFTNGGFNDIAVDRMGNIVAVGTSRFGALRVRVLPNGLPDPDFGPLGVRLGVTGPSVKVLPDPQGRLAVIDESGGTWIERLLANGDTDTGPGHVNVAGAPQGAAMLGDGTLVLLTSPAQDQFVLTALTPQGPTDARWSGASEAMKCPGFPSVTSARIALAPGNRILAVLALGDRAQPSPGFCFTRFNADGSVDLTYGTSGHSVIPYNTFLLSVDRVAVHTDGSTAVVYAIAGLGVDTSRLLFATSSGTLDVAKANAGLAWTTEGVPAFLRGMAFQPDGKLLVAGLPGVRIRPAFDNPDFSRPTVARFTNQGVLDTAFGTAGTVLIGGPDKLLSPTAITLDASNRILIAGASPYTLGPPGIARLLNDLPPAPPPPTENGGGGGGCGTLNGRGPLDPVLPSLVLLAAWALWRRQCTTSSSSSRTSFGTG